MKIEKLDRVVLGVENMDEAKRLFSDLLGITFDEIPFEGVEPRETKRPGAAAESANRPSQPAGQRRTRVAISPAGLELIERSQPGQKEGFICFHFKVSDYEGAKAEMEKKGIPLRTDITLGTLREAIYPADDLHGATMGLVAYETPTVMEAIRTKGI